ncbi:MAG: TetR family transcriptional regulator [Methanomassiliicoccaceae archaeon]|nr:TetR family transcriptional regulator [Methanomassiliicoccaceae archaeon]
MAESRQQQKARTRERITEAALRVYSENGFSTPTVAIANEAQVSHGSVFAHFPTVDDLLISSVEKFAGELAMEIRLLTAGADNAAALLGMHMDVLTRHEGLYKRLVKEASCLPEEARNSLIAIQSALSFHFMQAMEAEMGKGGVKDIPLHMIFNTWLGLIHHYLLNSDLFAPQGRVLELRRDELIGCFLELIRK